MALDPATNLELQKILGLEVSSLNTKSTSSHLSGRLDPDLVMSAEGKAWDGELRISQTSSSPQAVNSWKQKEDSRPPTGPSLLLSDPNIPKSTYVSSSKATTGQPSYTESVIRDGAIESALNAQSVKSSQSLGLPSDPKERKKIPLWSGLVKYFPDALIAVASVSQAGNEQHNPGKALHWDRTKSMDQEDTLLRHLWESGTLDVDGHRHSAKVAWRALAMLQLELENAK
jgi:hypothetical protein